jgi:hypothetical protein
MLRTRVWNKLGESKFYCIYVSRLIRNQLIFSKVITISILLLSGSGGIIGWDMWKKYPSVVCFIVAGVSLIKLVTDEVIPSEKSISSLHEIQEFYSAQFRALDRLWFDLEDKDVPNEEIFNRLNKICERETDINKKVNSTILFNPRKLVIKCKNLADKHFIENYNYG